MKQRNSQSQKAKLEVFSRAPATNRYRIPHLPQLQMLSWRLHGVPLCHSQIESWVEDGKRKVRKEQWDESSKSGERVYTILLRMSPQESDCKLNNKCHSIFYLGGPSSQFFLL